MKKFYGLLFFVTCIFNFSYSQNPVGLPDIVNYSKQNYLAGSQNWDIKQGSDGTMFFGNSEGLLAFDGSYWKLHPVPNNTFIRSLQVAKDGKIYVGAQNEIGYFSPDKKGELGYTSLVSLLPPAERSFADVWDVVFFGNDIFFRASNKIIMLRDKKVTIYPNQDWRFMALSNGRLIAQDHTNKIVEFKKDKWLPTIETTVLPSDFLITSFLEYNKDTSIITTLKNGLFILNGNVLKKIESPVLKTISDNNIYRSIKTDSNHIMLTTSLGGCFIVDVKGNLIESFSTDEGLQTNNIRSAFLDKDRNLWLGLDNGIDFLAFDNAIKHIYPNKENEGGGYAAIVHRNQLYLGTSNGLFYAPLENLYNISQLKNGFKPVAGSKGQVWNLSEVNDELLLGHHEGSFIIRNDNATVLDNSSGFWNFFPLKNQKTAGMFAGNYQGINFYNYQNGKFTPKIAEINFESARFVAIDNHAIWVAHPYKGVYKVLYNYGSAPTYQSYSNRGLSATNHNYVFKIKNKIVVPAGKVFYEYNSAKDFFQPSEQFNKIFNGTDVSYMKEDRDGNIWFISKKSLGVVDFDGAKHKLIYIPELNGKMVSGFEFIYPINSKNVLVGGEKGFYHINYDQYKSNSKQIEVAVRNVKAIDETEQLVFGGYYGTDEKNNYTINTVPQLNYRWNSLHFEFSSNLFGQQSNVEYAYFLEGFDKNWSAWFQKTEKDYTNLPPGNYTFKVKARNNFGSESAPATYRIQILPPWYRSFLAYFIYSLMAVALAVFFYKRQKQKFKKQRIKYEEEQKHLQYMHQLELERNEQAIIKLKNDKLETDINHKNKELAAATMHLVQKGELMTKIRDQLMKLLKNIGDEKSATEFKRVLRMMTEDEKFEEDWEQFSFHFDRVHGDFLMSLKNRFPNLTASELKLCAYLRMNLSTKEMAQLMNISVRGVEVSRYRLRKKLSIPTEANLFDYLVDAVHNKNSETETP